MLPVFHCGVLSHLHLKKEKENIGVRWRQTATGRREQYLHNLMNIFFRNRAYPRENVKMHIIVEKDNRSLSCSTSEKKSGNTTELC